MSPNYDMDNNSDIAAVLAALRSDGDGAVVVRAAADLARWAHRDQRRASGEPYFTHPLAVAQLCAELGASADMVAAALLHDVVEDTDVTLEDITAATSRTVAHLVSGLTKLDGVKYASTSEARAAEMRRMIVAVADDLRVVIIKLCDRLHNMRTLGALSTHKQERIARETLEIFAPLAHRLALHPIKAELEDLAFAILHPDLYAKLSGALGEVLSGRSAVIQAETTRIEKALRAAGIDHQISNRVKHLWSIHKKLETTGAGLGDIYDILGIRIIVTDIKDCYHAVGVIHGLMTPVPGRFKDYIASPRFGVYRSLHLTCVTEEGLPIEIQVRTREMHEEATRGAASHWAYKELGNPTRTTSELAWLNRLMEAVEASGAADRPGQQAVTATDFMSDVRLNLSLDELYVYTPQGDVLSLPAGAAVLDFAYAIHSDVGDHASCAKVNGKLCGLGTKLQTTDRCEIITRAEAHPKREWLDYAITSVARARIRRYLRGQRVEIAGGDDEPKLQRARSPRRRRSYEATINVRGHQDIAATPARCCRPEEGDALFGWLGIGRVVAHRESCPNVADLRRKVAGGYGHELSLDWQAPKLELELRVAVSDRVGLLTEIAGVLTNSGADIQSSGTRVTRGVAQQRYRILISDSDQRRLRDALNSIAELTFELRPR